mmetsp:Transcript_12060/g.28254  ORF Transcript_12060/g.28254 Transcript_12060/m.28254 type:complete len:102 (+) Transcript_12060:920-1225(+)
MGRSYHLIASAGQDEHGQLKVHRLNRTPDGLAPVGQGQSNESALASADQPAGVWRVSWNATGTVLGSSGPEGVVRLWKSTFKGEWREIKAVSSESVEPAAP